MATEALPRTIIGIPGRWPTRRDIVTAIVESSGGYLFAGMVMLHIDTKTHFTLEVYEHDDNLAEAFSVAGSGRLSDQEIQEIDAHTFCLYLIGAGGAIDSTQKIMQASNALLNCGGLGVKIESAGTAHSVSGWRDLCAAPHVASMLTAFVAYVGEPGRFYSCGMHNLGYRDCVIEAPIDASGAAHLMQTFLLYLLSENPTIQSGETFSVDADARRYRIFNEDCTMYDRDDPFHNPFGIWRMVPA